MLSTDKLKNKEVINIYDGRSIGFVSDIEVQHVCITVFRSTADERCGIVARGTAENNLCCLTIMRISASE